MSCLSNLNNCALSKLETEDVKGCRAGEGESLPKMVPGWNDDSNKSTNLWSIISPQKSFYLQLLMHGYKGSWEANIRWLKKVRVQSELRKEWRGERGKHLALVVDLRKKTKKEYREKSKEMMLEVVRWRLEKIRWITKTEERRGSGAERQGWASNSRHL